MRRGLPSHRMGASLPRPASRDDAAWQVAVSAVLLAGAVAAAVSAAMLRYGSDDPVRIASVRLGEITAAYATEAAKSGETPEAVRAWGAALETALVRVAERHGVVLLPARAVAAGAPDMTAHVEATLADELTRSGANGSAPQAGSNP